MKPSIWGPTWRFLAFATVCSLAMVAMIAVFGQIRLSSTKSYRAEFTSVTGLENGNFVRIAGVEVGKVKKISLKNNTTAVVEFSADDNVVLTRGTRAAVRYENLIGGKYLALEEGAGDAVALRPGALIPLERTEPPLDLDALIGGFRPLFRALNPDQANALANQLIRAFQGEGATVASVLRQTASLTNTLADRDDLIGQVITNLNTVLTSLGEGSAQLDATVSSLSELISGLSRRKDDISNSVAYTNAAAATVADLLDQTRPALKKTVHETDRTAGYVMADYDYLDDFLTTLPDDYQILARQGIYGDYFSFYLCDLYLKLNGKGGNPVFVKVVGQSTGRCTPR